MNNKDIIEDFDENIPTEVFMINDIEKLYNQFKSLPKEVILYFILKLMKDNKVSFSDVAVKHSEYIQSLRRRELEDFMNVRADIISMWCGNKKDIDKSLVELMTKFKNEGWANITEDQINSSKWNKQNKR